MSDGVETREPGNHAQRYTLAQSVIKPMDTDHREVPGFHITRREDGNLCLFASDGSCWKIQLVPKEFRFCSSSVKR
jgi:hypothetical protein